MFFALVAADEFKASQFSTRIGNIQQVQILNYYSSVAEEAGAISCVL
jgi:hypothetical protein